MYSSTLRFQNLLHLAASCPPNVEGPVEYRKWQEKSEYSVTIKIELPTFVMFSDERKGVMRLLHQNGFGKVKSICLRIM